jgi:hypothetical protein
MKEAKKIEIEVLISVRLFSFLYLIQTFPWMLAIKNTGQPSDTFQSVTLSVSF